MTDYQVRRLLYTDNKQLAQIHKIAFKDFFLTSLGVKFLETFYASVLRHPDGFGVGLWKNGELVGFGVGTSQSQGFYKKLIRNYGISLLISALLPLIKNPIKTYKIITNLIGGSKFKVNPNTYILLSICVNIKKQSKGFGKEILKTFENECITMGAEEIVLTTSKEDNENVNNFYKNNDYNLHTSFKTIGQSREMNVYKKHIK